MYDRILIHVDRGNAFETYVPALREVLRRHITKEAVLTTVVEPVEHMELGYVSAPEASTQIDAIAVRQADTFLRSIAARLADEDVAIQTAVLVGDPPAAFRDYARHNPFDLVVIAPTGWSSLLTGKPRRFRRALHDVDKPVMILPSGPLSHAA